MRPVEVLLLAGAVGVGVLQSPTGRVHAARLIVHGGRSAGPAAVRIGRAARGRYENVLTRVAPPAPIPCLVPDCVWEQESPSSAELLVHMRTAHAPKPAPVAPASPVGPVPSAEPEPRRLRAVDDRPTERITQLAPGVYVGHQINAIIDKIGLHMDEFRVVSRALNAAGELEPEGLLDLLRVLSGVQTSMVGLSSLITDVAEYADTEMWADLRAIGPLYEAATNVLGETDTIRRAMTKLRELYAEEIAVEEKNAHGAVRKLNPKVTAAA